MNKQALRSQYKAARATLSNTAFQEMEANIVQQFSSIKLPIIHYFLDFHAIEKFREPNIQPLVSTIQAQYPLSSRSSPRVRPYTSIFDAIQTNAQTVLQLSNLNIPEPEHGRVIEPPLLDLILVPLLAFDRNGYRVGYGKGMYDQYLTKCRKDALKIGISLFEPVDEIEDVSDLDIRLDMAVTPQKVYYFS